jgi:regulator of protease activity HflC (stomatin/prohibitin superfamily)
MSEGGGRGSGHSSSSHGGDSDVNRRAALFVAIIASAIILVILGVQVLRANPLLLAVFLIIGAGLLMLAPQRVEIRQYERGVRFRLGKLYSLMEPGWHIVFPTFEKIERVDMRTQTLDIPPQSVISRDNVKLTIDAICFIRVTDPKKAIIEIKDYKKAIEGFLIAELRNVSSKMEMEGIIEKADDLNTLLHQRLLEISDKWGVTATRVEIEHITLPPELVEAMTKRQAAQEAKKRMQIEYEARAIAIEAINAAASKVSDTTMTYLYLETLKSMGHGKSTKFILPMELSSLASLLASKIGGKGN